MGCGLGDSGDLVPGFEAEDELRFVCVGGCPVECCAAFCVPCVDVCAHVEDGLDEGPAAFAGGPAEDAGLVHCGVEERDEGGPGVAVCLAEGVEGALVEVFSDDDEDLCGAGEERHCGGVVRGGAGGGDADLLSLLVVRAGGQAGGGCGCGCGSVCGAGRGGAGVSVSVGVPF